MDRTEIENQLQDLRVKWKNEPENRKILEIRAKMLKLALSKDDPMSEEYWKK